MSDSTTRFSGRVNDHIRYRPGYPGEILHRLEKEAGKGTMGPESLHLQ